MAELKDKVDFSIIRYANCWEDADVLINSLQVQPNDKILSVASAGDNSLSLLSQKPATIIAADISLPQLHLTTLKKSAFKTLSHSDLLSFLGVTASNTRLDIYNMLRRDLPDSAKSYWDNNTMAIKKGVIHSGKFENYFKLFRKYLLPLVHSQRNVDTLQSKKTELEQKEFFNNKWNTIYWQWLMSIFFSKAILGKYGRDPHFLKHVELATSNYIRSKSEQHLQSVDCQTNYMLHMILKGNYRSYLPHYLRSENYNAIKNNIDRLEIVHADVKDMVKGTSYNVYNLSNVFEYLSNNEFTALAKEWAKLIPSNAKLAFWNLMVQRSFSEVAGDEYIYSDICEPIAKSDKGFFYSRFRLEIKK